MKNKKVVYIIICVIIFVIGLGCGLICGINVGLNIQRVENKNIIQNNNEENTTIQSNKLETSKEFSLKQKISEDEIAKLKLTIEKDEADYGDNYQKLEGFEYTIKRDPDKIYFKSSNVDGFYCFENIDENYNHLLEVIYDRMFYSVIEDYNLYCFTLDSIDTMITSGDNYIIFDYDNGDLKELDSDFNKDIIFRFPEKTRLYRLATYLSYNKEFITRENLGKSEFATDTTMSGYKYMSYIEGD